MPELPVTIRRRLARASACAALLLGLVVPRTAPVAAAILPASVNAPSTSRFT